MRRALLLLSLAAACSSAAPAVRLSIARSEAGHALVIENHTRTPLSLKRAITVTHGGQRVAAESLFIRTNCSNPNGSIYEPPACVDLAPGESIRVAPWTDMIGDSQCACEECGPVARGDYELSIESCDGARHWTTAPFPAGR
jgi:hypothetical protein